MDDIGVAMIKNILFDLDDTLFDFHAAEKRALKRTFETLGVYASEEVLKRYSQINSEHWKMLEKGLITRDRVKVGRFEKLFAETGYTVSPEETAKLYENYLSEGHIFISGAENLLSSLYGKYRLYIVSNGSAKVQDGRIKSSGIAKYFENIFISQKVGFDKPNKEFFDACFSEIPDFLPKETVIIGDSLSSDIKGGKNAGITTVWFNPSGKENDSDVFPDFTVSSLAEIPNLVAKL